MNLKLWIEPHLVISKKDDRSELFYLKLNRLFSKVILKNNK
ncbi:hypothetical protein [Macrococcoides caseolyticum]|nr:hypothetical protein [Macrococcus caseolyticus]